MQTIAKKKKPKINEKQNLFMISCRPLLNGESDGVYSKMLQGLCLRNTIFQ